MFHKAKIALLLAWVGVMSSPVWGIGLGEIQLNTPLNEPLHAEIQLLQLRDLGENDLLVGLAPKEDFEAAGVERLFFLTSLKFKLDVDNPKGPMVIVSTDAPVREPYLNFLLEVQWPNGRLLREYTLLMDLPTYAQQHSVAQPIQGTTVETVKPEAEPLDIAALEEELAAADSALAPIESAPAIESTAVESSAAQQEEVIAEETVTTVDVGAEEEMSYEAAEEAPMAMAEEPAVAAEEPADIEAAPAYDYAPAVPVYATPDLSDYTTASGDNLWNIAVRYRQQTSECLSGEFKCGADGITIQQVMLAMQRANPDAFVDGNINRLKKGQVMRMPSQDEVTDMTSREAIAEVMEQNIAWSGDPDGRRDRGYAASEQLDATYADGSAMDTVEEYEDGRLKLTVPGSADGSMAGKASGVEEGSVEALQNELVIAMEELDRVKREKTSTNDQVVALNDQVETLEKMLEVRSAELQALQSAIEDQAAEEAAAEQATLDEVVSDEDAMDDAMGMEEAVDDVMEDDMSSEEMAADEEMAEDVSEEEAEPQPVETPEVVEEPEQTEPGFMDMLMANLMIIIGAIVAIVVAIGAIIFIRKRNADSGATLDLSDAEETMFDSPVEDSEPALDDADLDEVAEALGGLDVADEEESGDEFDLDAALTEEAPAEDTAQETGDALSEADIYISFGSYDKAESLLKSAIDAEPQRADLQLKMLEVYAGSDNLASFDQQFESLKSLGDAGAVERANELRSGISGADAAPAAAESVVEAAPAVEEDSGLGDLDLDLSLDDEALSDTQDVGGGNEEFDLDLSLDLDEDVGGSESPTVQQPALDLSDAPTVEQPALDASDMPTAVSPAVEVGEAQTEAREELDLDLDLDSTAERPATSVAQDEPTPADTGLDEEFNFLADEDEAATKLDLARAYIDMGDKDGAKDILQEVLEEGNDAQKSEAQELLGSIG